jgi:peptide deformylase
MPITELRYFGDPVLKTRSEEITNEEINEVVLKMEQIMEDKSGVGLSAPQVGSLKRLIIIKGLGAMINPSIMSVSSDQQEEQEGCLSLPGISLMIERPVSVHAKWITLEGEEKQRKLHNFQARIIQHEIDHLDGTLILDRAKALDRREAINYLMTNQPILK